MCTSAKHKITSLLNNSAPYSTYQSTVYLVNPKNLHSSNIIGKLVITLKYLTKKNKYIKAEYIYKKKTKNNLPASHEIN